MVYIESVKRFLWNFVELAFLAVLAVILIFLLLGDNSGVYVKSVTDNVMKFAAGVPTPSLIGMAVVVAIVYIVLNRMKNA